jgi:iron complex outermembrane receptor protein
MKIVLLLLLTSALFAQSGPADSAPARKDVIVVTGSYPPLPLQEADRVIDQLPVRDTKILFQNLADVLALDASLDLQQRGANGNQADLSIRGSTSGQTLVLVNGMRVDDPQTSHHDLNLTTPLDAVSSIEVLHGAGSSLYGSDALGGVVNIVTAPPSESEIRLRSGVGNDGINAQSVSLSGVRGSLSEQLSLERDFSSGFTYDRDYRDLTANSSTFFKGSESTTALDIGAADRAFGADQFYGDYPSWERTKTWFGDVRESLGSNTEIDFGYRHNTDLFVLFRDQPWIYANHHASETWQGAIRRHDNLTRVITLYYGAEGLGESLVSSNLGTHSRARPATYVSLDVRVWHRFSFSAGVRDEVYHGLPGVVTPSLSAGYWATSRVKLRASVSRAFHMPDYTELYYSDPGDLGNPNLKPESAWNYEGGADYRPSDRWKLQATVFERRDRNVIDYARASDADPWQAMNVDRLNFTGVESSLGYRLLGGLLNLGYTFLHGSSDPTPGLQSKYAFYYPQHSAIAAWSGPLGKQVIARTRIGALQRFGQSPYAVWDLYIARAHGVVRPFLQLANVTNTQYQEVAGVVMPGRTAIGGVELAWPGRVH